MIKDLKITMAASLLLGEEWVTEYRELPGGTLQTIIPNQTSNPIIIPSLDDSKCYYYGVTKKCRSGYLGEKRTGTIGVCDPSTACNSYRITNGSTNGQYTYTSCTDGTTQTRSMDATEVSTICAIEGSVVITLGTMDIQDLGICSAPLVCLNYYNGASIDAENVHYTDCFGIEHTNDTIPAGGSFCALEGTVTGTGSGFLIVAGNC